MEQLKQQLQAAGILYKENEPLSAHCTFRIGGPADLFVMPRDEDQLCQTVQFCKQAEIRYYLLGNGSNILFADEGFRGAVIDVSAEAAGMGLSIYQNADGDYISAPAGLKLSELCKFALQHGYTGLEFAYGIPGTVGGAVYMNAGAYGGEMKDVLEAVSYLTADGRWVDSEASELDFSYRHSAFEENDACILGAVFHLEKGDPDAIKARMNELMQKRIDKQPLDKPSAGSTFKRPQGAFAGKLIEDCGALVVSDRYCFGSTPGREVIELKDDEDALRQICLHVMEHSECARYIADEKVLQRRETADRLAKEYNAEGIIYEQMKYCDYWGFERALVSHIMAEEYGWPVLSIDRLYNNGNSGQLRTRVQAFVESLEIKRIHKEEGKA